MRKQAIIKSALVLCALVSFIVLACENNPERRIDASSFIAIKAAAVTVLWSCLIAGKILDRKGIIKF